LKSALSRGFAFRADTACHSTPCKDNSQYSTFSLAEGDSLNCRAFEVAGAGGLQIIEYRPAIEECFEPGKELLTFTTYDELLEHLDRARSDPEQMKTIRQAGARRALSDHTYRHRLQVILNNF